MELKIFENLSNKEFVYKCIVFILIISIFISLAETIFNFSFKKFIILIVKTFIFLFIIFSFIVEIIHRVNGYYEFDNFYYKLLIWDSVFICLLILLGKYNI